MKKKMKLIFVMFIITFLIISMFSYASAWSGMSNLFGGSDNKLTDLGGVILGAIYVVCSAAGVIAVVVAGIKYMLSSPSEKASIKGQMIGLAVGGILLFAGPQLVKLVSQTSTWWTA